LFPPLTTNSQTHSSKPKQHYPLCHFLTLSFLDVIACWNLKLRMDHILMNVIPMSDEL
jgi:hypothetical protein